MNSLVNNSEESSVNEQFSEKSETSEKESLDDYDIQSFIDDKLPDYFGVKSAHYQKSIVRGRHPVSIPKDSELWYYSKISAERREKIQRGYRFWDVINDPVSNKHTEKVMNFTKKQDKAKLKKAKELSLENEKSTGKDEHGANDRHHLKGSLQAQLKAAMAAQGDVNMKIDFTKKGVINYGMTFIIMNYANEVLYIDKYNELRAKPISAIQPSDRIKFKMLDLLSPSNPRAIHYGQNCWLQCLDSAENADNSFQAGSVLTTKLFGPPELEAVNFAENYGKLVVGDESNKGKKGGKNFTMLQDKSKSVDKKLSADKGGQMDSPGNRSDNLEDEEASVGGTEDGASVDVSRRSSVDISVASDMSKSQSFHAKRRKRSKHDGIDHDEDEDGDNLRDNFKAANVCGHVQLSRIVEMRKEQGHFLHDAVLSDEKALRYNSKQAMHLGKWTIQPARREDNKLNFFDEDEEENNEGGQNGPSGHHNNHHNSFIHSLTPIVIQQDHYCLSTAPSMEYRHWPPNSSSIVRNSEHIHAGEAEEYEKKYAKALINNINADHSTQSNKDLVSNHRHFENKKKLYFMSSKPFEQNPLPPPSHGKSRSTSSRGSKAGHVLDEEQYGCIRKVVHRSAPYDFVVDRRCVWKICLFEQFAENYVALTGRERQVQKVMETASMALKLSKMNREGAKKHMNSCHIKIVHHSISSPHHAHEHSLSQSQSLSSLDTLEHPLKEELPPLLGGEKFARSLREITFRTTQFAEDAYLRERRAKEVNVQEYFQEKIKAVLSYEESKGRSRSASPNPSVSKYSTSSLQSAQGDEELGDGQGRRVKFFATEEGDEASQDSTEDSLSVLQRHERSAAAARRGDRPIDRALLLNSSKNIQKFRDISAGEQLLSMHKTFNHYNKTALNAGESSRRKSAFSRPKAIASGVLRKMEMLQQEDKVIETILTCKEKLRKRYDDGAAKTSNDLDVDI